MTGTAEILERTLAKYRRCNSYLDRGSMLCTYPNEDFEIRFETYFLRPAFLRIEWQRYNGNKPVGPKGGLWSDGEHARVKTKRAVEVCDPGIALAATSGIATLLPKFLLTSYHLDFAGKLPLLGAIFVDEDVLEAGPCFILEGPEEMRCLSRYWILQSNFSIVQTEISYRQDGQEKARSDRELAQRERKMARILNRPAIDLPEPESYPDTVVVTKYQYFDVVFDAPLVESVFEFPPV